MKKILNIFLLLCTFLAALNICSNAAKNEEDLLVNDDRIFALSNKYTSMLASLYREDAARLGVNVYDYEVNIRNTQNEISKVKALTSLIQSVDNIKPESLSLYAQADYYTLKELINLRYFNTKIKNQFELDPMWYLQSLDTIYEIAFKDFLSYQERFDYILKIIDTMPETLQRAEENLTNPSDLSLKLTVERLNLELANVQGLIGFILRISDGTKASKLQLNDSIRPLEKALNKYKTFLQGKLRDKKYVDFRLGDENYKYLFQKVYMMPNYKKLASVLEKNFKNAQKTLMETISSKVIPELSEEQQKERFVKGVIKTFPKDYYILANKYKDAPKSDQVLQEYSKQITNADRFFVDNKIFPTLSLPINLAQAPQVFKNMPYQVTVYPPIPLVERQIADIFVMLPKKINSNKEEYALNYNYAKIKLNSAEFITPGKALIYSAEPVNISLAHNLSNDMFYINGWIKYALDTAYENDFFTTEEDKLNYIWFNYKKAVYALVDYKLQTKELDLDSALAYIKDAGIEESEAKNYLDYLALNPLDAVSYILGSQEFQRLRTKYKKQLGKEFDLLTFHTKVLSVGRIPIMALEKTLEKAYAKKDVDSYFSMTYF